MASYNSVVDQENMLGGRRRQQKKSVTEGQSRLPFGQTRSVLGQLNTNTLVVPASRRAQPNRSAKPQNGGFSIFCDDENIAPVKSHTRQTARHPLADKENIENIPIIAKPFIEDVAKQPVKPFNIGHDQGRKFVDLTEQHDSSVMEEETEEEEDASPMVLDTSVQEWRVPPLATDGDTVDIFAVPEYAKDIYTYLRGSETKFLPKWNYMSKQPDITHSMRAILVDWLVEVAEEYKLQTETLYLAVSYIDRFLSFMSVQRAKLQLVGTACMFIAAKYEEIYPPDVGEFVYITDDTYNKRQVLRMEHLVLKVLNFDLSVPSSHLFVSQIADMAGCDERTQHLAMYLNELSLMSGEKFLQYTPSHVAASSVALARHTVRDNDREAWPESLSRDSGFTLEQLQECLMALHEVHVGAEDCQQQAVREKYKSSKYHSVSEISPAELAVRR